MKILRITDLGYETGGVENGIVLLQPLFEERGHTVKTLASAARPDLPHFNEFSYRVLPDNLLGRIFYTLNPYAYSAVKKALKEFKPDVVHIHTIGQASPSMFFPLRNYPVVLTVHGPEVYSKKLLLWNFPASNFISTDRTPSTLTAVGKLRYAYHRLISDPLYALGFCMVDTIVTLSHYMHDLMQEEGLQNVYVPNGTVLLKEDALTKEAITNTLVYVGRLETYKGIEFAIRTLPNILKAHPNTTLHIAGSGEDKDRLQKITEQLHLEKQVIFLGHLDRPALEELYRKASIVLMPSTYPEAFGKVGIEAMSAGRPVIASDVGGVSDWLVHGENGFLVPPGDTPAIETAVLTLLSNPDLLLAMGKKAREKSEEFGLDEHVRRMEDIYTAAIAKYRQ